MLKTAWKINIIPLITFVTNDQSAEGILHFSVVSLCGVVD